MPGHATMAASSGPESIGPNPLMIKALDGGLRFAIHHPAGRACAPEEPRGLVVYLHPLAEEMNRSRRMAALQARALAQSGLTVLQIDLKGCGDSSAAFEHACWDDWLDDVVLAVRWLRAACPQAVAAPLWLWGLRAGALVAVDALRRRASDIGPCGLLLWHPALSGQQQLHQFLRLSSLDLSVPAHERVGAAEWMRRIERGLTPRIGGYRPSADLAQRLAGVSLDPPAGVAAGPVLWFDMAPSPVASVAAQRRWTDAGWAVRHQSVQGPHFWQTVEIGLAPELIDATTTALCGPVACVGTRIGA